MAPCTISCCHLKRKQPYRLAAGKKLDLTAASLTVWSEVTKRLSCDLGDLSPPKFDKRLLYPRTLECSSNTVQITYLKSFTYLCGLLSYLANQILFFWGRIISFFQMTDWRIFICKKVPKIFRLKVVFVLCNHGKENSQEEFLSENNLN